MQSGHAARHAFEVRLAVREGYQQAETDTAKLVTYLEALGADVDGEESAVDLIVRVMNGYRERNDLLERARMESDEIISNLENDAIELKKREKKARQSAWEARSELTILKDRQDAATRTGAIPVSSGFGSGPNTDSIRTVRVPGLDKTAH